MKYDYGIFLMLIVSTLAVAVIINVFTKSFVGCLLQGIPLGYTIVGESVEG